MGRGDEHAAEHLHVQVAVERFHKSVVRQARAGTEEHQGHLPLDGEQGACALRDTGTAWRQSTSSFPLREGCGKSDRVRLTQNVNGIFGGNRTL